MRLSARYKNFWARGKDYQHFWLSSGDVEVTGVTLTATASIIAGQQQADASAAGATLTDTVSLTTVGTATGGTGASQTGDTLSLTSSLSAEGVATGGTGHSETGQTFTITASLTSGETSVEQAGYLFDVPVTLNEGHFGEDASAPLNTRLNARYRHFWGRKRSERHFWAQYEGAGIGSTLTDGQLVVSSLAVIDPGQATADANLEGVTLTIAVELDPAHTTITEPGQLTVVSTVIAEGVASADANLGGETFPIAVELIQGRARDEPVATITTSISEAGTVFVPPDALAIPEPLTPVVVSLSPGVTITDALATGADQEVIVELIAGTASTHVDGEGATLTVDVSLDQAGSSGDAFVEGVVIDQRVLIFEGVATGESTLTDTLTITTSLISGVATGEDNSEEPSTSARAGGPVGYQKAKEQVSIDAQAFGAFFQLGTGIVAGKPTVNTLAELPQPSPNTSPSHMQPVDVVHVYENELPPSITKLLEVHVEPPAVQPEPVSVSPEPARVQTNWTEYDNALFDMELL